MSEPILPHRSAFVNQFHVDTCYPGWVPLYDQPLFSVYFLGKRHIEKSQGQSTVFLQQHEFPTAELLEKKLRRLILHACLKSDRVLSVSPKELPHAVNRLDYPSVVFIGKKVKAPDTTQFVRHPGIPSYAAIALSDDCSDSGVISFRGVSHHYGMSVDASRLAWFHVDD